MVADYRQKMAASGNLTNLLFVTPDYYEERPKGCMGGWGYPQPPMQPFGRSS